MKYITRNLVTYLAAIAIGFMFFCPSLDMLLTPGDVTDIRGGLIGLASAIGWFILAIKLVQEGIK